MQIADSDAFHFALFLRMPDHQRIAGDEKELALPGMVEADRLELRPESGTSLNEAKRLILYGHGYQSKEQAHAAADRARMILSLAALEANLGIEWEERQNGLDIWQGIRAWGFSRGKASAGPIVGTNTTTFRDCVIRWACHEMKLTTQQQACCDLLADFHFDMSGRSRFLLAHAAIEVLAINTPKGRMYCEAVDQLAKHLEDASINSETKQSLVNDLQYLRQFSITARCEQLIGCTLGSEAVAEFTQLAKFRHKIAHHGRSDNKHRSFELYHLAVRLLLKTIER